MTPKEKAERLVSDYCKISRADNTHSPKYYAKECALRCVNEILKLIDEVAGISNNYFRGTETNSYVDAEMEEEFLTDFIKKTNLPERTLYKNNKNNKSNCYFFMYSGKNAEQLANFLYKNATIFLTRKYKKLQQWTKGQNYKQK